MRNNLNAAKCEKETKPGRYADGGGLYLLVKPDCRKTWVFRFRDRVTQKQHDMGLGPFGKHDVTLADARVLAGEYRKLVRDFVNPIEDRRQRLQQEQITRARRVTFEDCVTSYVDAKKSGWRNEKHVTEWSSSLRRYAGRLLNLPVAEIDTTLVVKVLEPIWADKTETATRVRQRIEAVLNWATVRHFRRGENPARWKGHLENLLPKPSAVRKVEHLPALDYRNLGEFMRQLRQHEGVAAGALQLLILTACRPGEVVGAKWGEFDLAAKIWTVPAARMKAKKDHTVPLSPQAVKLLKNIPRVSEYVFPGGRSRKKHMTTAAGVKLAKDIQPGITAHGFRSTFRDWAADQTSFPREVIEHALAHQLPDKTEAAYFRSDLLAKRARLMKDWATYCDTIPADAENVTPIRKGAGS